MLDFREEPSSYTADHFRHFERLPPAHLEAAQLSVLQQRLVSLRDRIGPLRAMADYLGIRTIGALEEVVPLLFPHSFYKSYPTRLLDTRDFAGMTAWLSQLTIHDLSPVAGGVYGSIDAWLGAIDNATEVRVYHSSGTSGGFSLMPRGRREVALCDQYLVRLCSLGVSASSASDEQPYYDLVWPTYAGGRSGILRGAETLRRGVVGQDGRFFPLFTNPMSTDLLYCMVRQADAEQQGKPLGLEITPYLQYQQDEYEQTIARTPQLYGALLQRLEREARGRRVLISGAPNPIYYLAREAIARGMEGLFASDSVVNTYGGGKGSGLPDDLYEVIARFSSNARVVLSYGMTELLASFNACEHGRHHCPPWIIPFSLHVETGVPLPREGVQRGRAAFFDLAAQSYWGGIVSGDLLEMSWEPCACGRNTPHLGPDIARCAPQPGNEHAIGSAPMGALLAALDVLGWEGQ